MALFTHSHAHNIFLLVDLYRDVLLMWRFGFVSISHSHSVRFSPSSILNKNVLERATGGDVVISISFSSFHSRNFGTQHCRHATTDILLNVISMRSFTQFVILPFACGMWSFISAVATVTADAVSAVVDALTGNEYICFDGWSKHKQQTAKTTKKRTLLVTMVFFYI